MCIGVDTNRQENTDPCRRIRGRPRNRWIEDVEEDIQRMGIRGWRKLCKERMD